MQILTKERNSEKSKTQTSEKYKTELLRSAQTSSEKHWLPASETRFPDSGGNLTTTMVWISGIIVFYDYDGGEDVHHCLIWAQV